MPILTASRLTCSSIQPHESIFKMWKYVNIPYNVIEFENVGKLVYCQHLSRNWKENISATLPSIMFKTLHNFFTAWLEHPKNISVFSDPEPLAHLPSINHSDLSFP